MENEKQLLGFLGVDQYGGKYLLTDPRFPRKQLLNKLSAKSAKKIYIDNGKHNGYIVRGLWVVLYRVYSY